MKKTVFLKTLSLLICAVLIAAMATAVIGCKDKENGTSVTESREESIKVTYIGEGKLKFSLEVDDGENKTFYSVSTDKEILGDALLELKLISGEKGQYGLMVNEVNGVSADNKTCYWAFYIGDNYASTGVDGAKIESGAVYALKLEKI